MAKIVGPVFAFRYDNHARKSPKTIAATNATQYTQDCKFESIALSTKLLIRTVIMTTVGKPMKFMIILPAAHIIAPTSTPVTAAIYLTPLRYDQLS